MLLSVTIAAASEATDPLPLVRDAFVDRRSSQLVVVGVRGLITLLDATTGSVVRTHQLTHPGEGEDVSSYIDLAAFDPGEDQLFLRSFSSDWQAPPVYLLIDAAELADGSPAPKLVEPPGGAMLTGASFDGTALLATGYRDDTDAPAVWAYDLTVGTWRRISRGEDWGGEQYGVRGFVAAQLVDDALFVAGNLTWEWYGWPDLEFRHAVLATLGYTGAPVFAAGGMFIGAEDGESIVRVAIDDLFPPPSNAGELMGYPSAVFDGPEIARRDVGAAAQSAAWDNPLQIAAVGGDRLYAHTREEWVITDLARSETIARHDFIDAAFPRLLVDEPGGRVYHVSESSLAAYSIDTGELIWYRPAAD